MIFIFPLAPILIAVFLLAASLLNEVSTAVDTITSIAWVLVIVLSGVLVICNILRKASVGNKILGTIISIATTIITMIESKTFLLGLVASSDTSSIMGTIEFGFVLIFGGCVWLASAGMCAYASFVCVDPDEFDDWRYLKAIGFIVGSLLLGGFFGLLG